MSRLNFFKYGMIALMFSNLILIAALIMGRPDGRGPKEHGPHWGPPGGEVDRPKEIVVQKLKMDEGQTKKFQVLIDHHREAMRKSSKKIFELRKEYYSSVVAADQTKIKSLDSLIAVENIKIENIHQIHFNDIKGILNDEQLSSYNAFLKEVPDIFFPIQRGPRK